MCRHTHDALIMSKRLHDPNGSDPGKQKLHESVWAPCPYITCITYFCWEYSLYDIIVLPNWVVLVFGASRLNKSRRKPSVKFVLNYDQTPNLSSKGADHSWEDGAKVDRGYSPGGIQPSATRLKIRQHEGIIKKFCPKTRAHNLSLSVSTRYLVLSLLLHWAASLGSSHAVTSSCSFL
jgi:hypothetical protein